MSNKINLCFPNNGCCRCGIKLEEGAAVRTIATMEENKHGWPDGFDPWGCDAEEEYLFCVTCFDALGFESLLQKAIRTNKLGNRQ
jgi:hypothetical protein